MPTNLLTCDSIRIKTGIIETHCNPPPPPPPPINNGTCKLSTLISQVQCLHNKFTVIIYNFTTKQNPPTELNTPKPSHVTDILKHFPKDPTPPGPLHPLPPPPPPPHWLTTCRIINHTFTKYFYRLQFI